MFRSRLQMLVVFTVLGAVLLPYVASPGYLIVAGVFVVVMIWGTALRDPSSRICAVAACAGVALASVGMGLRCVHVAAVALVPAMLAVAALLADIASRNVSHAPLSRRQRFWIASLTAVPLTAGINLVPYHVTLAADIADGCIQAGWPFVFYDCGGIEGHLYVTPTAWLLDFVACIAFAAIAGWAARDGVSVFCQRVGGFVRRYFTWQVEDEA